MSEVRFFQTRMGARFYEGTMPKIAEQLERLNDNLEALLDEMRSRETPSTASTHSSNSRTDAVESTPSASAHSK